MRFTSPISILLLLGLTGLSLAQDFTGDAANVIRDAPDLAERETPSSSSSTKNKGTGSSDSCKRAFEELSLNVRNPHGIFERASRCGQFCSNSAQCTDPACPLCAHSNGACEWQKSCRART